ncbi:elys transcription factor [Hyphodiscus hymeniophilus]|uniref:Elys transcription factor n=1 Tax=Hyphodiscus hymeniophilus TaxID=353542 RepID=A0A9P7AV21_9HELO|nr:elys transcription factor [Hyphodiscus hymeniophilus]
MFNYHHFEEVFSFDTNCSYPENESYSIEAHRKVLQGLFVDKVLKLLGIKRPAKLYPPQSNGDLRTLHKTIVESSGADHHKISVLYYILLDFDAPTGRRVHSGAFEENSFLPQKYQIYMKGLWHLDRREFEIALQYLTHPSLIPTFSDDILEALVRQSKNNDLTLALAYYHTVQPALTSSQALECLFSAIARTSVTEAFYFCRGQQEYAQLHMFQMLISLVLNSPPHSNIVDRSVELVNLPFTVEEDKWFEEYLTNGEGRKLRKAPDTLLIRKIATGRFTESLAVKGINVRAIGGMDWNTLSDAVQSGMGPRLNLM